MQEMYHKWVWLNDDQVSSSDVAGKSDRSP